MKVIKNPKVLAFYSRRIIDMMTGKREMPPVKLSTPGQRKESIHASDLDDNLCPLPAYYNHVIPPEQYPPLAIDSALKFFRGRVMERAVAEEEKPVFKDDIACTVDDWPEELKYPVEIKSTASTSTNFSPGKDFPFWISRLKTYCYAHDVDTMHLVVLFLVGNLPSFAFWTPKAERKLTGKYQGVDLDAWTISFTTEEIEEHWDKILTRKATLENCIAKETPPVPEFVEANLPVRKRKNGKHNYWQCKGCRWIDICYYYEDYVIGEKKTHVLEERP